ncbi:hypothetical protein [Aquabacter sediminis]|uniref:hypothetical protein n=1 Tax=Aquabacter sediminis TaxID=3029197 RepID=UPI00237D6AF0|nr:hypothetical protein [Aquabacter sp. P-9]MDE1567858.1 hypothetical protein [Aquabacter sp. P-9]
MHVSTRWPLPSPCTDEEDLVWTFAGSRVTGLQWKGQILKVDSPLFHLGAFPTSDDGTPFPIQFRFDPATGTPLHGAAADGPVASHPAGMRDGFPSFLSGCHLSGATERQQSVIPAGTVSIFSAGTPARIFALTTQGNLFFRMSADRWHEIAKLAPPPLDLHTFGVCAFETGFATVLQNTCVIAHLIAGRPELRLTRKTFAGAVLCGTPACIENGVLAFPIRRGTTLSISRYAIADQTWIDDLEVHGQANGKEEVYDPPIQNRSRIPETYWIGSSSFIRLSSTFDARDAYLEDLPAGLTAIRGAPVFRDERDGLHALVRGDADYAFLALSGTRAKIQLDGPCLSAGRGRYLGRHYYPSASTTQPVALTIDAGVDRVLLPLAYGVDGRGQTDGALLALVPGVRDIQDLFRPKPGQTLSAALFWHSGAQMYPLNTTLSILCRHDIILYRDNYYFYVGSALVGKIYRFPLP